MSGNDSPAGRRGQGFSMTDLEELPSTCVRLSCSADTTGQAHHGHCLHCGAHIGARSAGEWAVAVKAPCPQCGRPW